MKANGVVALGCALTLVGCGGDGNRSGQAQTYKLLFSRGGGIWSANPDGSHEHQLTSGLNQARPVGSPDGTKIAYNVISENEGLIEKADADGSNPAVIGGGSKNFSPQFSPDGTKIVFYSGRDGASGYDIYIIDSDGGNETRLTNSAVNEKDPCFLPDGRIVFSKATNTGKTLAVMNADGSGVAPINSSASQCSEPRPLLDGISLLFNDGSISDGQIATMKLDGTNVSPLTPDAESNFGACPTPDGRIVFFAGDRNGVDIMDLNGDNRTPVVDNATSCGILPLP